MRQALILIRSAGMWWPLAINNMRPWRRALLVLLVLALPTWASGDHFVRVFTMPDGTVQVVHPAPADQRVGESEAAFYARVMAHAVQATPALAGRPFVDVLFSTLPADRTKRHAWREKNGKIEVDAAVPDRPKSKEQQRKAVCSKIEQDVNAMLGLKELCATF